MENGTPRGKKGSPKKSNEADGNSGGSLIFRKEEGENRQGGHEKLEAGRQELAIITPVRAKTPEMWTLQGESGEKP